MAKNDHEIELEKQLNEALAPYPELLRAIDDRLSKMDESDTSAQMDGVLNAALAETGGLPSMPARRQFVGGLLASLASCYAAPLPSVVVGAAVLGAGAGGYTLAEIEDNAEKEYSVSAEFVNKLARLPYSATGSISEIEPRNLGEQALKNSHIIHAGVDENDEFLRHNLKQLLQVIKISENYDAKAYARSRWATDLFRLGETDASTLAEIKKIDVQYIAQPHVRISVLEYAASLSLNQIAEQDFKDFSGDGVGHVISLADEFIKSLDDLLNGTATSIGMSISSVTQSLFMQRFRNEKPSFSGARSLHEEWAECYQRGFETYRSDPKVHSNNNSVEADYASDYIYSLTRLAYHAAAWNDYDLAFELTDRAVGQGMSNDSPAIIAARERINSAPNLNVRWMWLLRATLAHKLGSPKAMPFLDELRVRAGSGGGSQPFLLSHKLIQGYLNQVSIKSDVVKLLNVKVARPYIQTLVDIAKS